MRLCNTVDKAIHNTSLLHNNVLDETFFVLMTFCLVDENVYNHHDDHQQQRQVSCNIPPLLIPVFKQKHASHHHCQHSHQHHHDHHHTK